MSSGLQAALAAYLSQAWDRPVAVENLARIPGGASRQTYRFDAIMDGARRGLILRRDPVDTLLETDRRVEFLAYQSFHPRGIPTPEPVLLEEQGGVLERPFFIMGRVDGGAAANPFSADPYGSHAAQIGEAFFTILGKIAAAPVDDLPVARAFPLPDPQSCWSMQLAHWEGVLDHDAQGPLPVARAAIRRLRRAPPPPAQTISVVHGDYRSGNFLHDGAGAILAVLDWEMAHLGDPLEDLGWAIDPLWGHFDPARVGGMMAREAAVAVWERASGLTCDPQALAWWELFNAVKGLAIWVSAAKSFRDGGCVDPVLGLSGWYCLREHEAIIARRLVEEVAAPC
jgi:aminoglycoside phosphotransferase (APT) family kinase protein